MGQSSKEAKKRWLDANKEKRPTICRNWKLRRFYGISLEEYDTMLRQQNNKCAICNQDLDKPYLDHEHASGWVRGILCSRCNFAIGLFDEDTVRMQAAIEYLIANVPPPEFNIVLARDRLKKPRTGNKQPRTAVQKEHLRKIRLGVPAWNKGKEWDIATREKMSIAAKSRWKNVTEEQLSSHRELGKKAAAVRWESRG